jgi:hypothetical protein
MCSSICNDSQGEGKDCLTYVPRFAVSSDIPNFSDVTLVAALKTEEEKVTIRVIVETNIKTAHFFKVVLLRIWKISYESTGKI